MRWLLVLLLINGLVPGFALALDEVVQAAVERVAGQPGSGGQDGPRGAPHDCPSRDACLCCSGQVVAAPGAVPPPRAPSARLRGVSPSRSAPVSRDPSRPFRPPIG